MGRALWGYTLPGNGMQTERSGLCVTESGQVLYGWGDDVSGTALGKAFRQAGCAYAMHLDMNPHHTGFIFSKIVELKGHNYRSELLTPLMTVSPDRYIEYAPKDFFYMLLHDETPAPIGAAAYRVDPGVQPPPAWAPSVWSATVETRDGPVEVTSLEAGRARYRIRAGQKEPDARTGASPLSELDADDTHRVVLSLSLGHAIDKRPRGLATDGRLCFPLHGMEGEGEADASYGELIADQDGALSIVRPHEVSSVGAHVDLAELPLLVDEGKAVGESRHGTSASPRGALGITLDGRVLVARGSFGTDAPLADVLLRAGCRRAVTLDRGAHAPPALLRTGTATPPRGRPEETTLFALSAPMKPRAFRFEPSATVAPAGHPR
jgi:hypothetical protein